MAKEEVKFTRKELKEDELVTFSTKALKWLEANRKPVLLGLIMVIVVIFLYYTITAFVQYRAEKASDDYIEAVEVLTRRVESQDQTGLASPPKEEIRSALLRLEKVYERYRSTGVGRISLLRMAQLNYDLRDYEKSQRYLQEFLNQTDSSDALYLSAWLLLANVRFAKMDFNGVLDACNGIINTSSDFLKDEALYISARALMKLNRNEEAKSKLKEIVETYQNSHLKKEASEIIKSL